VVVDHIHGHPASYTSYGAPEGGQGQLRPLVDENDTVNVEEEEDFDENNMNNVLG
jgi:hypothetical protein